MSDGEELVPFGPLQVAVAGDVLEVREWTLAQSEWGASLLPGAPEGPVLELCAGVGHIGLAALLLAEGPPRRLVQVELTAPACALARENAARHGAADRVEVRCGELLRCVYPDERFALALADPPYVPSEAVEEFPEDPEHAIDGGEDGLEVARECLDLAARHLLPGASLVLQLWGVRQVAQLQRTGLPPGLQLVEVQDHGPDRALARLVREARG